MTFQSINMEVTKSVTVAGKTTREKVGTVEIYVPLVSELITTAVQALDTDKKPLLTDDGLPVYTDENLNWLQEAILASVKANARNKLVAKTADLKQGASIPTDWASLTAESVGGGAVHLVAIREVKVLFAKWFASLGKSQKAKEIAISLFNSVDALTHSDAVVKGKIAEYVGAFVDTLTDEETAKYSRYLDKVADAATSEAVEADDF